MSAALGEMGGAARQAGWPPVSDMLADEVLLGAKSGALTYRDAWHLIGAEAFRQAEAREAARRNAVV